MGNLWHCAVLPLEKENKELDMVTNVITLLHFTNLV